MANQLIDLYMMKIVGTKLGLQLKLCHLLLSKYANLMNVFFSRNQTITMSKCDFFSVWTIETSEIYFTF